MIKDNDKNQGLEVFASFVNSLPNPVKPDLIWQYIPAHFGVSQLGPELKKLGIKAIAEHALLSPGRSTDLEQELDQLVSVQKELGLAGSLSFFKAELRKPQGEASPFIGTLRAPIYSTVEYRITVSKAIRMVNRIRYLKGQQPIPGFPF